ncbi:hypothetical protein [Mycoplasma zalophidermidis]|uniref:hypothetical protein n=1 Tax=Mycoplasma zalophidermidis TaxID=398174 RepID=UPI00215C6D2E|nr:hypothetical protein [Mycoplasma zalophidermidis]MCR8966555.1 hypothetical protein [Mycoplasma zalophidermidis]
MNRQRIYSNIEFAKYGLEKKIQKGQDQVHDWEFYSSGRHLRYIARVDAVYVQDDDKTKFDLESEFKKSGLDFKSWMNLQTRVKKDSAKSGVYRLFENPKDINVNDEIELLNKILQKQIVWEMIINPGQFGVDNFMLDKNEWADLLNVHMRKLLKANHLDPENIRGHWVMHSNTDFPHVHLSFWEINPNTQTKKEGLVFKQKGWFSKKSVQNFNNVLSSEVIYQKEYRKLNETKAKTWDIRKHIKAITTLDDVRNEEIYDDVFKVRDYMLNRKNKTYVKADEDIKEAIWNIFDYVQSNNDDIKMQYQNYMSELEKLKGEKLASLFNEKLKNNFIDKEKDEFEKQIGNLIIKLCLNENEMSERADWFKGLNSVQKIFIQKSARRKSEAKRNLNLKWIIDGWNWEANGVHFRHKLEALRSYRKNVKARY